MNIAKYANLLGIKDTVSFRGIVDTVKSGKFLRKEGVHEAVIQGTGLKAGFSASQIREMEKGSVATDYSEDLLKIPDLHYTNKSQVTHFMKSWKYRMDYDPYNAVKSGGTVTVARKSYPVSDSEAVDEGRNYIKSRTLQAWDLYRQGRTNEAYQLIGMAQHTIQDSYSHTYRDYSGSSREGIRSKIVRVMSSSDHDSTRDTGVNRPGGSIRNVEDRSKEYNEAWNSSYEFLKVVKDMFETKSRAEVEKKLEPYLKRHFQYSAVKPVSSSKPSSLPGLTKVQNPKSLTDSSSKTVSTSTRIVSRIDKRVGGRGTRTRPTNPYEEVDKLIRSGKLLPPANKIMEPGTRYSDMYTGKSYMVDTSGRHVEVGSHFGSMTNGGSSTTPSLRSRPGTLNEALRRLKPGDLIPPSSLPNSGSLRSMLPKDLAKELSSGSTRTRPTNPHEEVDKLIRSGKLLPPANKIMEPGTRYSDMYTGKSYMVDASGRHVEVGSHFGSMTNGGSSTTPSLRSRPDTLIEAFRRLLSI